MSFKSELDKYRKVSFNEEDKGERFERLMKAFLLTNPTWAYKFKKVWLWNKFPGRPDLRGDTGIDLVGLTVEGDHWVIQRKCYQETITIDRPGVDSSLSTSSRIFRGEDLATHSFATRLSMSATN